MQRHVRHQRRRRRHEGSKADTILRDFMFPKWTNNTDVFSNFETKFLPVPRYWERSPPEARNSTAYFRSVIDSTFIWLWLARLVISTYCI